jgi:hypothetical protein
MIGAITLNASGYFLPHLLTWFGSNCCRFIDGIDYWYRHHEVQEFVGTGSAVLGANGERIKSFQRLEEVTAIRAY